MTGDLTEHRVKERVTLNWSSRGDLIYTGDGGDRSVSASSMDTSKVTADLSLLSFNSHDDQPAPVSGPKPLAPTKKTVTYDTPREVQGAVGGVKSANISSSVASVNVDTVNTLQGPPNAGKLYRINAEDYNKPEGGPELAVPSAFVDVLQDDISRVMALRAVAGYGLQCKEKMSRNGGIAETVGLLPPEQVASLKSVWRWMERAYLLTKSSKTYLYHGLLSILSNLRSDTYNKSWSGLEGSKHTTRIFRSEERSLCLQLVSWLPVESNSTSASALSQNNILDDAINLATSVKHYSRAAALAVFQLHLPRAISILQEAASYTNDPSLNAVAMALAGYSGERKMLWRDTCASLRQSLNDPHLRAVFAFLTEDSDSYSPLLLSNDLSVCDRIGFALTFLSDARLVEFLSQLLTQLTEAPCPDIQGLILTGMSVDTGVSLVQKYIDRTSDIQTAALLAAHGFRHTVSPASNVLEPSHWLDTYLELLSNLRLWTERASLVVLVPQEPPPSQHVVLACEYCNKSIAASHPAMPTSPHKAHLARMPQASQHHTKNKMLSCPHCRKPLPRCALCLQHLGTPSYSPDIHNKQHRHKVEKANLEEAHNAPHHLFVPSQTQARLSENLPGLNPFANWFTWCQTCRHGGHANHVMDWFNEHDECPVTGCTCQCLLQDNIGCPTSDKSRSAGDANSVK